MAKSIRSKAKRKLRAAKREKIVAKERLRLLEIKKQEDEMKMVEGQEDGLPGSAMNVSIPENNNKTMEAACGEEKSQRKTLKSSHGKNVKRLGKKKKKKYKW